MKQKLHPTSKLTTFTCATCGSKYQIYSTCKESNVSLDVCSHCHPVFVGKSVEVVVKGRAEKLVHKFSASNKAKKTKKTRVSKKKNIIHNLDQIKA